MIGSMLKKCRINPRTDKHLDAFHEGSNKVFNSLLCTENGQDVVHQESHAEDQLRLDAMRGVRPVRERVVTREGKGLGCIEETKRGWNFGMRSVKLAVDFAAEFVQTGFAAVAGSVNKETKKYEWSPAVTLFSGLSIASGVCAIYSEDILNSLNLYDEEDKENTGKVLVPALVAASVVLAFAAMIANNSQRCFVSCCRSSPAPDLEAGTPKPESVVKNATVSSADPLNYQSTAPRF